MSDPGTTPSIKLREKGRLMSASEIERTLVRLAHEIAEKNEGTANVGLVGIKRRGVPLAQRLAALLEKIEKRSKQLALAMAKNDSDASGARR